MDDVRNVVSTIMLVICIISIALLAINIIIVDPVIHATTGIEYRRDIGSHWDNALAATTHEVMHDELVIGLEHAREAGIDNDSYNCLIMRDSHDRMDYWIAQVEGIISRLNDTMEWFDYANTTEEYVDMYGQKIENIRSALENVFYSPSDMPAGEDPFKQAWYIENHVVRHVIVWWLWWILLITILVSFIMFVAIDYIW